MALFGGQRDMSLFRTVNKELINDIIDTEIYYYKLIIQETKTNLYGEGKDKTYYSPVKIPTLIDRSNADKSFEEFGTDYKRTITFAFLRDTLVDKNIFPEIGDVIEWNEAYFTINAVVENQLIGGQIYKNFSVVASANMTQLDKLQIENVRVGDND